VEYLLLLVQRYVRTNLLLKTKLSKRLLRVSLKRQNQTYIIAGNTADAWRKTSLKKLKTNQNIKKINYKPNSRNINQTMAK